MRAARFYGRRDIRLEEVPEPGPLSPREVLLRPRWCGICGTDLHEYLEGARVVPSKPHPRTGTVIARNICPSLRLHPLLLLEESR